MGFAYNFDKCLFSKKDVSMFFEKGEVLSISEKSEHIKFLAPKHKITAVEFDASESLDIEDIIQSLFHEVETLIGLEVEKNLTKYSDEKKIFIIAELLKDIVVVVHNAKHIKLELMTQLQRLSLTLKRHTRSRFRIVFVGGLDLVDRVVEAGLRMEYLNPYYTNINEIEIDEVLHVMDVEIKLERRGIERFLADYIEIVKLRPRVKSFLGNL